MSWGWELTAPDAKADYRGTPAGTISLPARRSFALLVDLDGTMADTVPVCVNAVRATLMRHVGKVHSDAEILAHFGYNEEEVLRRMAPDCWQACASTYIQEYERAHDLCPDPFPGILDLLRSLRSRGIRLGLVTGKGRDTLAITFRRLGFTDLFDEVRCGSPDPKVKAKWIGELLRVFRVSGHRAAYVGDAPADIRAARSNGILALAAAWAPNVKTEPLVSEHPDALLDSVSELARWLGGWLGRD